MDEFHLQACKEGKRRKRIIGVFVQGTVTIQFTGNEYNSPELYTVTVDTHMFFAYCYPGT